MTDREPPETNNLDHDTGMAIQTLTVDILLSVDG